jgi:plastocyanin
MQRRSLRAAPLACLALLVPLSACGDDDDATPTSGQEGSEQSDAQGGNGEDEGGGGAGGNGSLTFTAVDIDFERDEVEAAAGELQVALVNEGAIEHSWLVDGHESDLRLYTQQSGDTDEGTITLEPGEYTYYCDIPGHRSAGMEGTLTLE